MERRGFTSKVANSDFQLAVAALLPEDAARALFNLLSNRALRRAALLGCRTPFSAALSRELTAANTAACAESSSPEKMSFSALVIFVLHRVLIDLFLSRLFSVTRTFFRDVLAFANIFLPSIFYNFL